MAKLANWASTQTTIPYSKSTITSFRASHLHSHASSSQFRPYPFLNFPQNSCICQAKKKNSQLEPLVKSPKQVKQEVEVEEVDQGEEEEDEAITSADEYEDGDDAGEFFEGEEDEEEEEEAELFVGDGAGGGGISLAGTEWDSKALAIAEDTLLSFNGELKIYAFKTLKNSTIRVRIEKLTNRSGSPSMADIEDFSSAYRAKLDEAEKAGFIPENTSLEVSSPGVERVVQIPQDLDRFKDRPMYVKYVSEDTETGISSESDGVFKLVSFDLDSCCCTWGIADVKINRERAGKGRPLNKKQREWRLNTPFTSLRVVRIYSDI